MNGPVRCADENGRLATEPKVRELGNRPGEKRSYSGIHTVAPGVKHAGGGLSHQRSTGRYRGSRAADHGPHHVPATFLLFFFLLLAGRRRLGRRMHPDREKCKGKAQRAGFNKGDFVIESAPRLTVIITAPKLRLEWGSEALPSPGRR